MCRGRERRLEARNLFPDCFFRTAHDGNHPKPFQLDRSVQNFLFLTAPAVSRSCRERERERRLESRDAHGGKRSKLTRDRDRDVSEKIALGQVGRRIRQDLVLNRPTGPMCLSYQCEGPAPVQQAAHLSNISARLQLCATPPSCHPHPLHYGGVAVLTVGRQLWYRLSVLQRSCGCTQEDS